MNVTHISSAAANASPFPVGWVVHLEWSWRLLTGDHHVIPYASKTSKHHQTLQVPKMEVLTYVSCMDTAYVRENPPPK